MIAFVPWREASAIASAKAGFAGRKFDQYVDERHARLLRCGPQAPARGACPLIACKKTAQFRHRWKHPPEQRQPLAVNGRASVDAGSGDVAAATSHIGD